MALSYVSYRSGIGHCYNNRRRRAAGPSEQGDKTARGARGQRPSQMLENMFILSGGQIIPTTLRLPPRPPPDFQTFLRPCRSCKCHGKWDAVHCWTESRAAPTNSNKVRGRQKWGHGDNCPPPHILEEIKANCVLSNDHLLLLALTPPPLIFQDLRTALK